MAEEQDEKTEEPTQKRIEKAREDGDVPLSNEVRNFAALVSALVIVGLMAPWVAMRLKELLASFLERIHTIPTDLLGFRTTMVGLILEIGWILLLPVGFMIVVAFAGTMVQVGFLWTPKKLRPKLNKLNVVSNAKKVISTQKLIDTGKDLFKIVLVSIVVAVVVIPNFAHPDVLLSQDFLVTLSLLNDLLVLVVVGVVVGFLLIAAFDLWWTRHTWMKRMKMTKQEVKDEHKQQEGDPVIKGRIRALRMKRYRDRMMKAVPTASVVITNPTHYAVALHYDMEDMAAPKVVAKGVDHMARRIREVAEENDVPIVENPPLARALYAVVELDQEVPPDHYKAVAEVIGFVMRLKGNQRGRGAGSSR